MFFVKLMVQLVDLGFGLLESFSACGRDFVKTPAASPDIFEDGLQHSTTFQSVEKRVESTWPNAVSMMLQFFHHRQAEDWLMRGMHKHMNPYQA